MSNAKMTAGPWELVVNFDFSGRDCIYAGTKPICLLIAAGPHNEPTPDGKAIVAVPDLLKSMGDEMEAMNAIIDQINDGSCDLKETKHRLMAIQARQSAVLKKAGVE